MLAAMLTQAIALGIFFFEVWHLPGGKRNGTSNQGTASCPTAGSPVAVLDGPMIRVIRSLTVGLRARVR